MSDKRQERDRAMTKVRKLLALAGDGRGNVQEAETAARQAAHLMEKYNIEAAEAQLADLCSDEPDLTQEFYVSDYDPGAKQLPKDLPAWVGFLAIGVGWLCQVKVDGSYDPTTGAKAIRFSGYSTDVAFAKWLLPMLCRAVFNEARAQWGHGTRADREVFRRRASGELQRRMKQLREEQRAAPPWPRLGPPSSSSTRSWRSSRSASVSRAARSAAITGRGRTRPPKMALPTGAVLRSRVAR